MFTQLLTTGKNHLLETILRLWIQLRVIREFRETRSNVQVLKFVSINNNFYFSYRYHNLAAKYEIGFYSLL